MDAIFPPLSRSYFPTYDPLRDNYQRREIDTEERASRNSLRRLFFFPLRGADMSNNRVFNAGTVS